jgi:hypothetical protein
VTEALVVEIDRHDTADEAALHPGMIRR